MRALTESTSGIVAADAGGSVNILFNGAPAVPDQLYCMVSSVPSLSTSAVKVMLAEVTLVTDVA